MTKPPIPAPPQNPAATAAVGRAIRQMRETQGISVSELAKAAGLDAKRIVDAEVGTVRLDPPAMEAVSRALGVHVVDLFQEVEKLQGDEVAPVKSKPRKELHGR